MIIHNHRDYGSCLLRSYTIHRILTQKCKYKGGNTSRNHQFNIKLTCNLSLSSRTIWKSLLYPLQLYSCGTCASTIPHQQSTTTPSTLIDFNTLSCFNRPSWSMSSHFILTTPNCHPQWHTQQLQNKLKWLSWLILELAQKTTYAYWSRIISICP